ncbi:MAG: hypothetical protein KJO07_07455 [Deltaproteobacteria bacterium]|nr:hypothetical protein [Deltaproteobacteria bacterium]
MSPELLGPPVLFVKLSGSLITDKKRPETLRVEVTHRLARELVEIHRERPGRLVLGHGSGSFGHAAAARFGFDPARSARGQGRAVAAIQDAAARLHRHVAEALIAAGGAPYSIVPGSAFRVEAGNAVLVAPRLLGDVLDSGMVPVVFGDVVTDTERMATILSTEALFLTLVRHLLDSGRRVEGVVWLGETPGLFDSTGDLVRELDAKSATAISAEVSGASGVDVTGGMRLRLETVAQLSRLGVPSWIADGRSAESLRRLLSGAAEPCTFVRPAPIES